MTITVTVEDERDSRYEVEDISTFKPCDGDARFRRLYANVRRKERMGDFAQEDGGADRQADMSNEFEPERKDRENLSVYGNSIIATEKEDLHYGEKA